MRTWRERLETFAIDVILERETGPRATALRWLLNGLSRVYRRLVNLRLLLYDRRLLRQRLLGCTVISVGNLTVGGTGKTPVVEKLARELRDGGRRVAILSRGYKSKAPRRDRLPNLLRHSDNPPRVVSDGQRVLMDSKHAGDEPFMLATNLHGVYVLVDKDRVKSGLYALRRWQVDTLVLDDGFQYLPLGRRINIVLIDRQAPFGNDFLLPRGTLREAPENLQRAHLILITKSRGHDNRELIQRLRQFNRSAEIIECGHRPLDLRHAYLEQTLPLEWLKGRVIGALSGIAMPDSFENALVDLGAEVNLHWRFPDHHRFSADEIERFSHHCINRDLAAIITTEKDAVRLPRIEHPEVPVYYLRVEIEVLSNHENWERLIRFVCEKQPLRAPEKLYA